MDNFEVQKEAIGLIKFALSIDNNQEQIDKAKKIAILIAYNMVEQSTSDAQKLEFWNYVMKSIREDF